MNYLINVFKLSIAFIKNFFKKNSYANVTELKIFINLATLNTNSIQPSYFLQKKFLCYGKPNILIIE